MTERAYWSEQAACRESHAEGLFADSATQKRAKAVCTTCVVRVDCLTEALDSRVEFGVWGGMTERERRALLRRRPQVTSWRPIIERSPSAGHEPPRAGTHSV